METVANYTIGLLGVIVTIITGVLGWLHKKFDHQAKRQETLETEMDNFKANFYETKTHADRTYATKEELYRISTDVRDAFKDLKDHTDNHFNRLYDKLDQKADK